MDHLLIVLVGCASALALIATDRLIGVMPAPRRTLFLAYASLILVAMPWLEVGQREHIVLIGTVPYAALAAARKGERPVPVALALAVGICAALGFALKHYFLVVPILLELWVLGGLRRKWRPIRPETAAMLFIGLIYATMMLVAARRYLSVVAPMLLLAYGATGAKHVADLFQPAVLAALSSLILLAAYPRFLRSETSGLAVALAIAAFGFTTAYFIQAKGWSYHAVPMLGCSALALAACVTAGERPPLVPLLIAPALLCLPFTITAQVAMRGPQSERDIARALAGMRPGDGVAFLAADPSFGWHDILQKGLRFSPRYNGFWMMQAVVDNEARGGPDQRLTILGKRVVRETVLDLECRPPRRIVVARPALAAARAGEFDILPFFLRDPQFANLLAHYRPVERTSVELFELQSPLERPSSCPRWSPV